MHCYRLTTRIVVLRVMARVVHAPNDLLTTFDLRSQNLGVCRDWITRQYGGFKKKFFEPKFFSGDFSKNFFFDFLWRDRYQKSPLCPPILIKCTKKSPRATKT